jgi:hypothetical protein
MSGSSAVSATVPAIVGPGPGDGNGPAATRGGYNRRVSEAARAGRAVGLGLLLGALLVAWARRARG